MEIESEIKTMVATNNMQQKIMIVVPILLVARLIKSMSPEFAANFATATGIPCYNFCYRHVCGCLLISWAKKILEIRFMREV